MICKACCKQHGYCSQDDQASCDTWFALVVTIFQMIYIPCPQQQIGLVRITFPKLHIISSYIRFYPLLCYCDHHIFIPIYLLTPSWAHLFILDAVGVEITSRCRKYLSKSEFGFGVMSIESMARIHTVWTGNNVKLFLRLSFLSIQMIFNRCYLSVALSWQWGVVL